MLIAPFETERLQLRPLEKSDVGRLFLLDSNPEVMKYVGQTTLSKPEETEKVIEMIQSQYEKFGIGRFAVVEKETGLLIGWSGLKFIDYEINGFKNFYEVGYRFLPESWGKGYATECGKSFINKAFNEIKVNEIFAYAHTENTDSHHVLKKLGFKQNGNFEEPDGTCYWFELKK